MSTDFTSFFSFAGSVVTANNLGGQGPVTLDPPYIQYEELMGLLPPDVVLRVENVSAYTPSFNDNGSMTTGVFFNGLSGEFGQINVLSDTEVSLQFSFLNKTDETPFVLDEFFFTWFDLDQNNNNFRQEKVILNMTFDEYFLNPQGTTVNVTYLPDNMIGFCSTVFGNTADNPTAPMDLTEEQKAKAVSLVYRQQSGFYAKISVGGPPNKFGRNLIFGGESTLLASPPPPSPPPSPPPAPFQPGTGASPPPPGIVIKSDPHFQGLDGKYFDFDGEAGNIYSLLLQEDDGVELIARFETAFTTGINYANGVMFPYKPKGTWLTSVGLRVTGDDAGEVLVVATSPLGQINQSTRFGYMLHYGKLTGDLIRVEVRESGATDVIAFYSERIEGTIDIVPPPSNWLVPVEKQAELTHLNIGIERLSTSDIEKLDGVLGVTATGRHPEGAGDDFQAYGKVDDALLQLLPSSIV